MPTESLHTPWHYFMCGLSHLKEVLKDPQRNKESHASEDGRFWKTHFSVKIGSYKTVDWLVLPCSFTNRRSELQELLIKQFVL